MPIVLISNADVIQFVFDRCYMQTSEFFRARSNTHIELQYIPRELLQCFGCWKRKNKWNKKQEEKER